ncbi:GNAT family N-acetyltransferase [Rhizobium lusitanum]|nr:GNAT family N-acetyltransferase [Rhizobium lusitanum]NTJ10464.1 GNAT family N-acetyltransferase [Rhizobium lusitanum]
MVATKIRLLLTNDPALPALAALMEEMQAHYQVPCPSRAEIIAGLKAMPQGAEILIVEENDATLGFAAFSGIYPGPGLKPGIFLKELFVSAAQRSRGLGRDLMRALAELAQERGLARIDWTADPENARLLDFYDGLGGTRKPDKLFYRLDGKALEELTI